MFFMIEDAFIDAVKILPFLFLTYLVIEYIEHKNDDKVKNFLKRSSKFGPIVGSLLGVIPQCGFSAAASNFYAGKIITLGTLIAVFLSTSDEMLPILISTGAPMKHIIIILVIKVMIGIVAGVSLDLMFQNTIEFQNGFPSINDLCQRSKCKCKDGVVKSAAKHAIHIFLFLFLITFILNIAFYYVGDTVILNSVFEKPIIGELLAGLIGLIPNCGASVLITQLYVKGVMGFGAMMSGLLVGAGTGLLVLFKVNKSMKENIRIVILLYIIGVVSGTVIGVL
ncbi:MAG: putative manganese transporter [Lachnospiraceae bacterium]